MRLFSVIVASFLFTACGMSQSTAIRVTNVSGAAIKIVDDELAKEIESRTSGGQEVTKDLEIANDALQEGYRSYGILRAATEVWISTGTQGDWQNRAMCMVDALYGLENALRVAHVSVPSEVDSTLSYLKDTAEGTCPK